MSKVGEVFDILLGKGPSDNKKLLTTVAIESTYAENACWQTWRLHDPVSAVDFVAMRKTKQDTGKWPALPKYALKDIPEGSSPSLIAKALCPTLASVIYGTVAHHIGNLYLKNRFAYLSFRQRLPVGDHLRIRFREKAVRVLRDPANPQWFQIEIKLLREPRDHRLVFPIKMSGKAIHTAEWLGRLADTKAHPSGGCIAAFRRKGTLKWQISLTRDRNPVERDQVKDPIPGRTLICSCPTDCKEFLKCEVEPVNGRPWAFIVEGHDLLNVKRQAEMMRVRRGRNYRQSPFNAAHGHGRNNLLRSKRPFSERYENRIKNWIENRSISIVREAIKMRCESIKMEDLSERDPSTMLLGSFPYFRFQLRIKQKAVEAGLKFSIFSRQKAIEALKGDRLANDLVGST